VTVAWYTFPAVTVGGLLMMLPRDRDKGGQLVTVSRVGSRYVYVNREGCELIERFDRATGQQDTRIGYRMRLLTLDQYEESKQRADLFADLKEAGIEVSWKIQDDLATGQLRALLAVVRPAEGSAL
jgi:hypothetical protein